MIHEFNKLNTLEEKTLFLDTVASTLLKVDIINDYVLNELLELDHYLDDIDFWDDYNGPFIKVAERIEELEYKQHLDFVKNSLSDDERFKLMSLCKGVFYYEKPIIIDIFNGNNYEIASILILPADTTYSWTKLSTELKLIEMMQTNGHVDVHYCFDDYVIKTMC